MLLEVVGSQSLSLLQPWQPEALPQCDLQVLLSSTLEKTGDSGVRGEKLGSHQGEQPKEGLCGGWETLVMQKQF